MLDKKIFEHIHTFKKICPKSRIEIVTNGDPLNKERLKRLFESGLDKILISVYDGKEDVVKFQNMIYHVLKFDYVFFTIINTNKNFI